MNPIRNLALGLLVFGHLFAAGARADDSMRPEVGKPLQAAQELIKAQKYKEAMVKVKEAEAVPGRTAYENYILERMRGAAANGAGDAETAVKAYEAAINSGKLTPAEQLKMLEAMAGTYYRAKDYAKAVAWAQRYFKDGGTSSQIRTLQIQAQYLGGDYAAATKELVADLAANDAAGQIPTEDRLQLLANCNLRLKDFAAYAGTLERLVGHYPKKEYWADLISRIQRKPGFSNRLTLDVYRLQSATGNLHEAEDYMEMAQLALQSGLPAEAKRTVDEAYTKGAFGKGGDADRHKRLRELANKQAADDAKQLSRGEAQVGAAGDGNSQVSLGYAYVTNGQFDKGIALMEKGIAKGGLKRPEEAKLHLGEAYLQAGDKVKARQALRSVQGSDGAADIARLWLIQSR